MSNKYLPRTVGEGLMIPRIATDSLDIEPVYQAMGLLIGSGNEPDVLSATVVAKQWGSTVILGHDYEPVSPRLTGIHLEDDQLVATEVRPYNPTEETQEFRCSWPPKGAYEMPIKKPGMKLPDDVVEIEFDGLSPFFEAERRRHFDDKYVKRCGIVAFGLSKLGEHLYGTNPVDPFLAYHDGAVIVAPTKSGKIAVSNVGRYGTVKNLLGQTGKAVSGGHHDFEVKNGNIYGKEGDKTTWLPIQRSWSRHVAKFPLSIEV